MRAILLFTVAALACLASTSARDMFVGTNVDANHHYTKEVHLNAIPHERRETEKHYSYPGGHIIKGINCRDVVNKEAVATITSGGVGHSNVTIRFESEIGKGLTYVCVMYRV